MISGAVPVFVNVTVCGAELVPTRWLPNATGDGDAEIPAWVPVPVIGLPTSVGYGHGGQGAGALSAMLQSCAPGLVVVNIDNGIGAGATAALIANRVAEARREAVSTASPRQQLDQAANGGA